MVSTDEKKRVFISEDDDGIVDLIQVLLEERGYQVLSCMSCDDPFSSIDAFDPQIAILDLWMPKVSGEEITRYIRSHPRLKDIPVVILSASRDIVRIAQEIGATTHLPKPFDINEFESLVERLLSESSSQTTSATAR